MQLKRYDYAIDAEFLMFTFHSIGPNGNIMKAVKYNKFEIGLEVYNLAFGDLTGEGADIDDLVITNNGDMGKILATVAETVVKFTTYRPHAVVIAQGSTPARTRLYRMNISKYHSEIGSLFLIRGFLNGEWQSFKANQPYEAFLVRRK